MILIGQYDSPFVRRVGIALTLYGLAFEHRPWSVFGDTDKIRPYNPLVRVPTLVLDDGEVLMESHSILDYLDSLVGRERALFPPPSRRDTRRCGSPHWRRGPAKRPSACSTKSACTARCPTSGSSAAARRSRAHSPCSRPTAPRGHDDYWFGDQIGHADIAVAAVLRFIVGGASRAGADGRFPGACRPRRDGWKRCRCSRRSRSPSSRRRELSGKGEPPRDGPREQRQDICQPQASNAANAVALTQKMTPACTGVSHFDRREEGRQNHSNGPQYRPISGVARRPIDSSLRLCRSLQDS